MAQAILLQGDHPTLPLAELEALLDVQGGQIVERPTSRVVVVEGGQAAGHMVQARAWGELWGVDEDCAAGIERLAQVVADRGALTPASGSALPAGTAPALASTHDDPSALAAPARRASTAASVGPRTPGDPAPAPSSGTAAVRSIRYGDPKSKNSVLCERTLGTSLAEAGHAIDLRHPELQVFAWLGEGRIIVGQQRGGRDQRFESRRGEHRAHFSPVGMHPRRAAGLVHMARVPSGGRILDPFCGTGGIVLEAALLGFEAWASDIDPWMVQGTLTTLTDAGPEPLDAHVFCADIGDVPRLLEGVQGIVTDLPYGTASSTHDEDIGALYDRALAAFAQILPSGAHAVVGHARPELLEGAAHHGLGLREQHSEFVHRSLTRHYAVLQRC